jgi:hypothetical protein
LTGKGNGTKLRKIKESDNLMIKLHLTLALALLAVGGTLLCYLALFRAGRISRERFDEAQNRATALNGGLALLASIFLQWAGII